MIKISIESHLLYPLLNVFNYKYDTWNEEVDQTVDLHAGDVLIKVSKPDIVYYYMNKCCSAFFKNFVIFFIKYTETK